RADSAGDRATATERIRSSRIDDAHLPVRALHAGRARRRRRTGSMSVIHAPRDAFRRRHAEAARIIHRASACLHCALIAPHGARARADTAVLRARLAVLSDERVADAVAARPWTVLRAVHGVFALVADTV